MQEYNRCLTCGDEIPNGRLYCLSCIEESALECKATKWIRDQGWDEETLPNDEYVQMKEAYIAGAKEYKQRYIDMNKAYQELVNEWVIDYRELEQENEQLKARIEKNGIVWHDLRKDPNDLPPTEYNTTISDYVITDRGVGYYNGRIKSWWVKDDYALTDKVIAWCEVPKFEVEE